MLLTISTTHRPATDLGHLLRKNPARVQSFALNYGQAHVFYPESTEERCTAALLLGRFSALYPAGSAGLIRRTCTGMLAIWRLSTETSIE